MAELLASASRPLVYAHLGDLHITDAKARNYRDFLSILAQLEVEGAGQLDFVYLPGDVADNGQPAQYRLVAAALRLVGVPVHIITGDHDKEPGSLANFYALPAAPAATNCGWLWPPTSRLPDPVRAATRPASARGKKMAFWAPSSAPTATLALCGQARELVRS